MIRDTIQNKEFFVFNRPLAIEAPSYIERSAEEIDVPNVVTAVLASYRGYDTLGETTVIFTACIGVMVLLRGTLRRRREEEDR